MQSDVKELSPSSLVMRLERNQTDLLKMKSALSSYTCEPRTLSLFERCEALKSKLEHLSKAHDENSFIVIEYHPFMAIHVEHVI